MFGGNRPSGKIANSRSPNLDVRGSQGVRGERFRSNSSGPASAIALSYGSDLMDRESDGDDEQNNTLPPIVKGVMSEIEMSWSFMTEDDFNPVPHSLSLLDSSTLGKNYKAFTEIYGKLESAMDVLVNDYHQAFNSAIQAFSGVVDHISDSQRRTRLVRQNLEQCRELLQCKRFDLLHLFLKSLQYKEMSRLLDVIDDLQKTPSVIESLISRKLYLAAVRTLMAALKTANGTECREIGGLEQTRENLIEIQSKIHETLIEELHNHLYLKSPFSLERLGKQGSNDNLAVKESRKFASKASDDQGDETSADDDSVDPETDSNIYMASLIEGLFHLGKLADSSDMIKERMSIELYYLVERTLQETSQQATQTAFKSGSSRAAPGLETTTSSLMLPDLFGSPSKEESGLLVEFLSDLYKKLQCVLEGHAFVVSVVQQISKENPQSGNLSDQWYMMKDVVVAVESEVKTLISDYITTSKRVAVESNDLNQILRERRPKKQGVSKNLYHLAGLVPSDDILALYHKMEAQSQNTSGGLDTNFGVDTSEHDQMTALGIGIVDKYAHVIATGHRMLVHQPDAYNILAVFGPTCEFIINVEGSPKLSVFKCKFSGFIPFMDDFIMEDFMPQIEQRVLDYYNQYVNGSDAFQTEYCCELSGYPLLKSGIALVVLIHEMCRSLLELPVHQDEFVKMIEILIIRYYEKCCGRFRGIMSQDGVALDRPTEILTANWAQHEDLVHILIQNTYFLKGPVNKDVNEKLGQMEIILEQQLKSERSLYQPELIFDLRKIQSIAHLHHSTEWLLSQIIQLRIRSEAVPQPSPLAKDSLASQEDLGEDSINWSLDSLPAMIVEEERSTILPLTPDMITRTNDILDSFQNLSEVSLFSLRIEVRLHCMYYLDLAFREGSYVLDSPPAGPDGYIGMLNNDMALMEECLLSTLMPRRMKFVFDGIAALITHLLCNSVRYIRRINDYGADKLIKNYRSLQQNINNISSVEEKSLDRAGHYFKLLQMSPEELIESLKDAPFKFSFDEYRVIIDLKYADGLVDETLPERKTYNEVLAKLKAWFVKH
ncbi:Sec8 exocyst complex component-specific domain-containing protein [Polychytrium aggregatum]|uniref:Sec8 exocyst complex component-specific domain-containing protein n=1 Tax=Polychytrium aggregatum TaxID=110093 RepID=UPI0022FEF838|nr:Sec8 exocyst complex component-specific domain-containing protein [Polychytrium aggregatum]KAI9204105.1 Sec8 exocyst complex component-specific domain-containing protein [Polychytrium aggregatum]